MSRPSSTAGVLLVPVDFSPSSAAALRYAARMAEAFAAPVRVLHVIHDPSSQPGSYVSTDDQGRLLPLEKAAEAMLADFLARVAETSPRVAALGEIETTLVSGLVPTRILEVAERVDAFMIVMGSLGRTGLSRLMLGSKAQRVVQLSEIPVTIVKAPRPEVEPDSAAETGESNGSAKPGAGDRDS